MVAPSCGQGSNLIDYLRYWWTVRKQRLVEIAAANQKMTSLCELIRSHSKHSCGTPVQLQKSEECQLQRCTEPPRTDLRWCGETVLSVQFEVFVTERGCAGRAKLNFICR